MAEMKREMHRALGLVLVSFTLTVCAPAAPTSESASQAPTPDAVDQSRVLRVVLIAEPEALSGGGGSSKTLLTRRMFIAGLAAKDSNETSFPVLAESLPQLNTDTWKVFPDGSM